MKLLAFDQSTVKTGYSVFDDDVLKEHGVVDFHKEKDTSVREVEMFRGIQDVIKSVSPDVIAVEGVALQTNPQVLMKLGRLQGEIIALAWQDNIPVDIYLPSQWRKILEFKQGKGIKRKDLKVQAMDLIKQSYHIEATEDESEAITIGLAWLKDHKVNQKE